MIGRIAVHGLLLLALACAPDPAPSDPELDTAWAEYQRTLDGTRERLQTSRYYQDAVSQAEAFRYLAGLIALQNRTQLHFGDPGHPAFIRPVAIGNKWGFSNPDNLYLSAKVEGGGAYRVVGRLGSANQTTIGSYAGDTEDARAGERVRGEDLAVGENGEFELVLGGERRPGNWLPLDPEATSITVYQIFGDWDRETKGAFRIERIGEEGSAPEPLDPSIVGEQLVAAATTVRHYVDAWLDIADRLSWIPANSIAAPQEIQVASLGSWFVAGRYEVGADQVLVVEVPTPTQARYWGFTLYNAWSETLDYANRQTSLNFAQARVDPDGVLRLVLAAEDPGVPNWLDIAGHPRGFFAWRVTSEVEPARPEARVVDRGMLHAALPATTTLVDAEARRRVIHRRQQHVARRYAD